MLWQVLSPLHLSSIKTIFWNHRRPFFPLIQVHEKTFQKIMLEPADSNYPFIPSSLAPFNVTVATAHDAIAQKLFFATYYANFITYVVVGAIICLLGRFVSRVMSSGHHKMPWFATPRKYSRHKSRGRRHLAQRHSPSAGHRFSHLPTVWRTTGELLRLEQLLLLCPA